MPQECSAGPGQSAQSDSLPVHKPAFPSTSSDVPTDAAAQQQSKLPNKMMRKRKALSTSGPRAKKVQTLPTTKASVELEDHVGTEVSTHALPEISHDQLPSRTLIPGASAPASDVPAKGRFGKSSKPRIRIRYRGKGPTKLRKGKQVVSKLPMDVWVEILSHCPAKFLAKARRINKSFYEALQYESAWKKNRVQSYGTELPDPFPGMKEDEYASLLGGLGCMGCGTPKTRKTYWIWQKRWCAQCLEKNTFRDDAARTIVGDRVRVLSECIPYGLVDHWGHYEMADRASWPHLHGQLQRRYKLYSKADIARLIGELEELENGHPDDEEARTTKVEEWYALKQAARDSIMQHSREVEAWEDNIVRSKHCKNIDMRKERSKFFIERAQALDPPLEPEALDLIVPYRRAIEITRPPSERAWKLLLPKIEVDRAAAEEAIKLKRQHALRADRHAQDGVEYLARLRRRVPQQLPEQRILSLLAHTILGQMHESQPPIADEDFALMTLQRIRQSYYEHARKVEEKYYETITYRLLLEDARSLLVAKIIPSMADWGVERVRAASLFKCPGCTRTDAHIKYKFEDLFMHLVTKHANVVGDFRYLYREGLRRLTTCQWLNIEWPANLPVLPLHQTSTGKWDPHDTSPYVQAPKTPQPNIPAFEGREVTRDGPASANIVNNIIYAASQFRDAPLDGKCKTSIVVRYAVEKGRVCTGNPGYSTEVDEIINLPLDLVRAGLYDIFDRFRCAVCLWHGGSTSRRESNRQHPVVGLIQHFKFRHAGTNDWAKDMMDLPKDEELWRILNEPGSERALEVFERLFPRSQSRQMSEKAPPVVEYASEAETSDMQDNTGLSHPTRPTTESEVASSGSVITGASRSDSERWSNSGSPFSGPETLSQFNHSQVDNPMLIDKTASTKHVTYAPVSEDEIDDLFLKLAEVDRKPDIVTLSH